MVTASPSLYAGKMILAPMVRIGALPMRLLALEYGADLVYTEEMIDRKVIGSERVVNHALGTVDYVKKGKVIFRTSPIERDRVIFQVGSADPDLALQAALTVSQDVAGIDLNCGCPKKFSLQGGMGAALLKKPDLLLSIIEKLVAHSGKPVSCKIRLLKDRAATQHLIERLAASGIQALAVHCRTPDQRPTQPGDRSIFKSIVEWVQGRVPIIANGDFKTTAEARLFMQQTGVQSVMFARAAQKNVSMFTGGPLVDDRTKIQAFLKKSIDYDAEVSTIKYCIQCMWSDHTEIGNRFRSTRDVEVLCDLFDMGDYYRTVQQQWREAQVPTTLYDETLYDGGR